jgi:hypothetical protein
VKADQAHLEHALCQLRHELERSSQRQARIAALGDKQLEVPQKSPYPGYGVIEWEPLRSKQTGQELAEALQGNISSSRRSLPASSRLENCSGREREGQRRG